MTAVPVTTLLIAILAITTGFGIAIFASRRAVADVAARAAGTRIPPFILGMTSVRRRHDRVSGFALVALYFAFYAVVIAVW
jgi:hypothetical protein